MPYLSLKDKLIIAGFIITAICIPIVLTMGKETQFFKSFAVNNKTSTQTVTKNKTASVSGGLQEIPGTSPLSELNKLLEGSPANTPIETTTASSANLSFGPTLNMSINIEGRPVGKQGAKVFLGLASGNPIPNPTYLLTFTVNFPDNGIFQGLSLAGLNTGSTYTAYLKGPAQIDTATSFTMSASETKLNDGQPVALLSGDLNEDNAVNAADYAIAKTLYGTTPNSSNWNLRADLNLDNIINNLDLAIITKNLGKTGASGTWFSPPPVASASATPRAGGPSGSYESYVSSRSGYWLYVP